MSRRPILIVGAGFSGAVVAEQLSKTLNNQIIVVDERDHIGGNCYTEKDESTGITVHKYGPHIFNTDKEHVWKYIQQFAKFRPYTHRVKATYKGGVYSLPINLHTINQFFGKTLSPEEAERYINDLGDKTIAVPQNFEEQALKFIGKDLYEAFMYGYTKKQWGCEPRELPAAILKRLPVRFNYDDNYHINEIQGIPENGYTEIFQNLLAHPNIQVQLNTKFDSKYETDEFEHVFYTGPIDAYFHYKYGRLSYRTVYFEKFEAEGDFQGVTQMNFTDELVPHTRICEHKHFTPWKKYDKTICYREFSKETEVGDIPYYPKRLKGDLEKLNLYQEEVIKLRNTTFLGRLATYRYMDMHNVIDEALITANRYLNSSPAKCNQPENKANNVNNSSGNRHI